MIESSFKPAWWLSHCHAQTIYPPYFRKNPNLPNYYRERFITPDNDFIDVDFCGSGSGPIVILLHGLTGSSQSGYIKGLQRVLLTFGMRSAALNFRGCSGRPNNLARSYHSGETEDIHFFYRTLRQREPDTPIAAVGFSLGGNVLLKWLGEQGIKLNIFAAVAVGVPLLLDVCATKMDCGFSRLYRDNLIKDLKAYIVNKLNHLETIGQLDEANKIRNLGDLTGIKSFWQYDDRVVAKLHGFQDVYDYYRRSSSRQYLQAIEVPTLVIQAKDDPFMTLEVLPGLNEVSESIQLEFTSCGGHVGFVSGYNPLKPEFWLEKRVPEFILQHVNLSFK